MPDFVGGRRCERLEGRGFTIEKAAICPVGGPVVMGGCFGKWVLNVALFGLWFVEFESWG